MENSQAYVLFLLASLIASSANFSFAKTVDENYGIGALNRSGFPAGFIFGASSSSYQYEGAAFEDGKGLSTWDYYTHKYPERIADGSNGDVAIDQYHRYKEDVQIIKSMGLDAYRLSISWPRVIPNGKISKGVNNKGLMYYHNLIDELLANGIQPMVTLFHWDLPLTLDVEYGGFLSPEIVDDFLDYVDLCFREFGGKVKHWITLNEPYIFTTGGYVQGTLAPGRCSAWQQLNCTGGDSATEPYLVAHHQLLAHAAAVDLYRKKYQAVQKGIIGVTLVSHWFVPYSEAKHNQNAALRALDFMLGWFMDPITFGDYPHTMRSLVGSRLPKFTMQQSKLLKGSFDFLGLNYYTANYAAYAPSYKNAIPSALTDALVNLTTQRNGVPIGPPAASDWLFDYPRGLRDLLIYIKRKYNNPSVYITENGVDEANDEKIPLKEALIDKMRIQYYHGHLAFLQLAIKEGVDVRGYFAWSLFDDFEWSSGYTIRFGINYVDYKDNLKRYPKLSAHWFKKFLQK